MMNFNSQSEIPYQWVILCSFCIDISSCDILCYIQVPLDKRKSKSLYMSIASILLTM